MGWYSDDQAEGRLFQSMKTREWPYGAHSGQPRHEVAPMRTGQRGLERTVLHDNQYQRLVPRHAYDDSGLTDAAVYGDAPPSVVYDTVYNAEKPYRRDGDGGYRYKSSPRVFEDTYHAPRYATEAEWDDLVHRTRSPTRRRGKTRPWTTESSYYSSPVPVPETVTRVVAVDDAAYRPASRSSGGKKGIRRGYYAEEPQQYADDDVGYEQRWTRAIPRYAANATRRHHVRVVEHEHPTIHTYEVRHRHVHPQYHYGEVHTHFEQPPVETVVVNQAPRQYHADQRYPHVYGEPAGPICVYSQRTSRRPKSASAVRSSPRKPKCSSCCRGCTYTCSCSTPMWPAY